MNQKPFNPLTDITANDLPLMVLEDDLFSWFGVLEKKHTHGRYSHAQVMHRLGYVASQQFNGFREIPLKDLLTPNYRLKFLKNIALSADDKYLICRRIQEDLARPWYKHRYDFLGVFVGQLTGMRWIEIPWLDYCSESVAKYFNIHGKPNPADLDTITKNAPKTWVCLGITGENNE